MKFPRPLAVIALLAAASPALAQDATPAAGSVGPGVPPFVVRPGFRVTLAADDLGEARFLQFGDDGTLYLSQPGKGTILGLKDKDGDGTYETRVPFVVGQSNCHSMDFKDGYLWYTASRDGTLKKARDTDGDGKADDVQTVIEKGQKDGIPGNGGGHPFRGVLVTPDHLYITVSDPQNMTGELDSPFKTVYVFDRDGKNRQVFATGIRNTEKLQNRIARDGSVTDEIWGADHGSDWFGKPYGDKQGNQPITDNMPPDELNKLEQGKFYGHPYLMADLTPRPEFADRPDLHDLAEKAVPAAWAYPAHSANNGFTFLGLSAGKQFGPEFVGDVFQAQHGSWNRSRKSGYDVSRVLFDPMTGMPYGEQPIVVTLDGDRTLARPVDCAVAPTTEACCSRATTRSRYTASAATPTPGRPRPSDALRRATARGTFWGDGSPFPPTTEHPNGPERTPLFRRHQAEPMAEH